MTTTTIRVFKDKENSRLVTDAASLVSGISVYLLDGDKLDARGKTEEQVLAGVSLYNLYNNVKLLQDVPNGRTVEDLAAAAGFELLCEFEADTDELFVQLLLEEATVLH